VLVNCRECFFFDGRNSFLLQQILLMMPLHVADVAAYAIKGVAAKD
jgi:hypothetical protein